MPRREGFFDSELIARLSRLEITARRVVDGFLSGKNRSTRHGFSVEFVEHREYTPGDDLRHLDWKVLGRMDRFYIKRYEEETNINAVIVLDASASMTYRSGTLSKFEVGAYTASALAYLLHRQRDAVGLVLHDTEIRAFLPPSAKQVAVAGLAAKLLGAQPQGKTAFAEVLSRAAHDVPGRSLFILISDFFVPPEDFADAIRFLAHHGHDAMVLQTLDEAELTFPFRTNVLFRGLEDARELLTEPQRLRARYLEVFEAFLAGVRKAAAGSGYDHALLSTGKPLAPVLSTLLAARARKRRSAANQSLSQNSLRRPEAEREPARPGATT
jgi:uncharacterized protein (DUF58 family)